MSNDYFRVKGFPNGVESRELEWVLQPKDEDSPASLKENWDRLHPFGWVGQINKGLRTE